MCGWIVWEILVEVTEGRGIWGKDGVVVICWRRLSKHLRLLICDFERGAVLL